MLCAISGVVPEHPVVSSKSGVLFEKRLILAHLETSGKCPIKNHDLAKEDLIEVQKADVVRPRPAAAMSMPGLLAAQQNEWDVVMLENFQLKQQLDVVRKELSHTLYKHDAACRVIARLMKERDEARAAVAEFRTQTSAARPAEAKAAKPGQLPQAVVAKIDAQHKLLSNSRKARVISQTLATKQQIAGLEEKSSRSAHSTTQPGVLSIDRHMNVTATGGADGQIVLFDEVANEVKAKLTGHKKDVTDVAFSRTRQHLYSCSADATVMVWTPQDQGYTAGMTFKDHKQAVKGLAVHPTGDLLLSCGMDSAWNLYDVVEGKQIVNIAPSAITKGFSSCAFHPDGQFLVCGTYGGCPIWDVRAPSKIVTSLGAKDIKTVTSVSISENGTTMAAGNEDGTVKVWDLRKAAQLATLTFDDSDPSRPTPVNKVSYDHSGCYLAICTDSVKIYDTESAKRVGGELACLRQHNAAVTGCVWGEDAKSLYTSSMDRQVKQYVVA